MSKRDFILVASTAAITSLLTWFAATSLTTQPDVLRSDGGAASANPAPAFGRRDGQAVPQDQVRIEAKSADAKQETSPLPAGGTRSDDGTARDPALVSRKQREVGEQFSSFMGKQATSDPGVINARIEARFYAEEWNQEWAGSAEKGIRRLFDANEGLGGVVPPQVTCRSKNCQVVLSASSRDKEEVRVLSEKFMQAATRSDVGMKDKVVSYFPDASMGRVVFYLSENGNMDLFQ